MGSSPIGKKRTGGDIGNSQSNVISRETVSQDQAGAVVRAVNIVTGSDYTPDQVAADPKLQQRLMNPTEAQVREEATLMRSNLESAGITGKLAEREIERYMELRLMENKTEEDYARLTRVSSTVALVQNLEGISTEQVSPAMEFCHEWENKAEGLTGKKQEHALQMADMFRALATTEIVEPAALEAILKRRDITEEQKTQIKAMFLPNLETANTLAQEETPKPEIHAKINLERGEARRVVFLQPKLSTVLRDAGLDEKAVNQLQKANELQIKVNDRYSEKGDFEAVEKQNELAGEYGETPEIFAQKTYELANESGYFNIKELNAMAAMVSLISSVGMGETEAPVGAEAAAAQAQLMRDIQEIAREDAEKAATAKELIEELMDREEEAKTVGEIEDDELKGSLEEIGVSKDKTIEEAVEFMNSIIAQNTAVFELKERGEEGLVPSFNTDPVGILESHGLMEDGKLTKPGEEKLPELLQASAGDFQESVDIVALRLPVESEGEIREEAEIVRAYMLDPKNEEKREAAIEVLADPEFIAIRAAFLDALSENISKVMPAALKGFE